MASGNAVFQSLGLGHKSNQIVDPGDAGTFDFGDQSVVVCVMDPAGAETRTLSTSSYSGQVAILINVNGTNAVVVSDEGTGEFTIAANEAALIVSANDTVNDIYWLGVNLKGTST